MRMHAFICMYWHAASCHLPREVSHELVWTHVYVCVFIVLHLYIKSNFSILPGIVLDDGVSKVENAARPCTPSGHRCLLSELLQLKHPLWLKAMLPLWVKSSLGYSLHSGIRPPRVMVCFHELVQSNCWRQRAHHLQVPYLSFKDKLFCRLFSCYSQELEV